MADAVVSTLVTEVIGRLASLAIQEFGLLWGYKNDISSLKEDFEQIQAVLQDAENKRDKESDVALWLKSLRWATLEVENVLDEIYTQALLQRLHKRRGIKYRVRAFFSCNHNKYMVRVRMAHKVRDVRKTLDDIKSKGTQLRLLRNAIGAVDVDVAGVGGEIPDRETSSFIHDSSTIIGRDEEVKKVIGTVCNKDIIGKHENGEIRVYGIWGMGGLGKTTLAQLVYNHQSVDKYFELKCWVYVSEKFQVKEIIKGIIESIDKCECKLARLEQLQETAQNKLRGKKVLIVLDDVWAEYDERAKWDQLSATLSCSAEESIVVMTTRSQTTSHMFSKTPELQHELGCLSKEDAWLLFKKYAFARGRKGDDISELEPIGREIVAKCKGLPLAVKTLGSLMWSKSNKRDWQHMKNNDIWELQENNILPALKLSYDNLLPDLKRCFAYCCLFPKGREMVKDALIEVWVANGFIRPSNGKKDLYMLAEEIFDCLVWRSFFQVCKDEFGDDTDRFKMHDLLHDMARHVMGDDCLVIDYDNDVIVHDKVLHLSSSRPDFLFSPQDLGKLSSLRSVLMFSLMFREVFTFGDEYHECRVDQFFNHMYLRVLYLCNIQIGALPKSICKLKHLKYLNLSNSGIKVLPESIIYLQNLQYLNLSYSDMVYLSDVIIYLQNLQVLLLKWCSELCKLPEGLISMRNLKHLDIIGCDSIMHLPLGIKELSDLRILTRFPIDKETGAKIEELGVLNLLEGKLQITGLENVGSLGEAKSANLKNKALSALDLCWKYEREIFTNDEKVLEGLEPNPSLKELEIHDYMGKTISPSWMVRLRTLVSVTFYGCIKCEHLPPFGRFPNLKNIELWCMDSLKGFHDDDINMLATTRSMFLSLQQLGIKGCPRLVSLPSNFPKLEVLELSDCDKLVSLPAEIQSFKYMRRLKVEMCNEHLYTRYAKNDGVDWNKISHIPNIDFQDPCPDDDEDEDENESDD